MRPGARPFSNPPLLKTLAPAKVNLTLHILSRREDGYHDLESLVAFASIADTLSLVPSGDLSLTVSGPFEAASGSTNNNLVLVAARHLAAGIALLQWGAFHLVKRLPTGAGLGGGSSDAAAALRLLARLNRLPLDHPALREAARLTGADVAVCLERRPRFMRGIGDRLDPPLPLPRLFAVLVNPGIALPTAQVFKAWKPQADIISSSDFQPRDPFSLPPLAAGRVGVGGAALEGRHSFEERLEQAFAEEPQSYRCSPHPSSPRRKRGEGERRADDKIALPLDALEGPSLVSWLQAQNNDLETPALALEPTIKDALNALRAQTGCRLARMSGSGTTVFGLFPDARRSARAAKALRERHPNWWIRATILQ